MAVSPTRRRANIAIAIVVGIMVLTPLSYYTVRTDPYDERFAWRMFSSIRMIDCKVDISVGGQEQRLGSLFHEAWVGLIKRGRGLVLDGMVERLCADNPGKPVRVRQVCRKVDGKIDTVHDGSRNLCAEES